MIRKTRNYITTIRKIVRLITTLVVAPLAITFLTNRIENVINQQLVRDWQWITTGLMLLFFILLVVVGFTDKADQIVIKISNKLRRGRFNNPKIYILDGTFGKDRDVPVRPAITDFTPEDWRRMIQAEVPGALVKVGPWTSKLSTNSAQFLLNPFGEAYPEEDNYLYITFDQIQNYVLSGGNYINVAGLPFWYYHNPGKPIAVNGRLHAGPVVQDPTTEEQRFIHNALFFDLFPQFQAGIDWGEPAVLECSQSNTEMDEFGDITELGGNRMVKLFRSYEPLMQGLIPILRCQQRIAIGALKHGDGYFILAGFDLRGNDHSSVSKIIGAISSWINYERRKST